ncbi:hypothetical protein [Methylicorpusculum sp.]|uniref:hypothetical protein n=1 Tax=Methylicorpusculum sp. TaxID=2713644 RepID=UPI002ABB606C|nr:hypothetical protein [Methylicorpusculum sp.]MDZ4151006.1 hypothetical protein [Methylicorpusculum sp.]
MCSSPKSACSIISRRVRRQSKPGDYEAYARMLRDASANYERAQVLKEEGRQLAAGELAYRDSAVV